MKDLIDREKALDCFHDWVDKYGDVHTADEMTEYQAIEALPTEKSLCALCQHNDLEWDEEPCESCTMGGDNNHFKAVQRWIPCGEKLPESIKPVIITWRNNDPKSYYQYIVGKPFIGTGHYCKGKWFWYSSTCEDLLAEYGRSDVDEVDEAIEVIAWMPLPEPYREEKR